MCNVPKSRKKMWTTFCFALCCLPLLCESGRYCYSYYNYSYGGYTSYGCTYYLSIVDRFGIAYGVVAGIGLLVSLIVFIACKNRQRRPNNSTILLHGYPNVGYVQSGQHVVLAPQAGIRQTTVPQGSITNPVIPMTNQQHQTPRSGPTLTSTMGAEGTTQMSSETPKEQNKMESPPPYSL